MFWGILIVVLAGGVLGAAQMMDIALVAIYMEMGIGIGIGVATATVIFALGAGVVSAMDYVRKRKAS
ncbi:MAG: hypothetical protein DSZ35_09350 [Verrucomicrobia bacterium]|nr:MAG: hypothetical protein DSZ35_09350 [Verrucomicrobiota bacterium]